MSRMSGGEVIKVKPSNGIYTALAGAALVVAIAGLVLFVLRAHAILPDGLKWM